MTNFNKSFNFRNGVQVDVDKFIVRGSLVGIGTSLPSERFEVTDGNVKFNNLLIANNQQLSGIGTFNEIRSGNNVQIQGSSGVVTATAFYGDGGTLSNLPTSQWVDVDVGLGFTSIYAAGNVGVATNSPLWSFQVGADPRLGLPGIGINSNGNVYSLGIVSAFIFYGSGIGLTSIDATNVTEGVLPVSVVPQLTNPQIPDPLQVNNIIVNNKLIGNVEGSLVGIASTARDLTSNARVSISSISANTSIFGISTVSNALDVSGNVSISGIATISGRLVAGISSLRDTQITGIASITGTLGINTSNPASDIHISKDSDNSELQITSPLESQIFLGRSVSKNQNVAGVLFGNANAAYQYSNRASLDIINYDLGSVNSYLHAGSLTATASGINTGSFNWIYGKNLSSSPLMTLTYQGRLGLGTTEFAGIEKLKVSGIASVTQDLYVGQTLFTNDATVSNSLTVNNSATIANNLTVNGEANLSLGANTKINITSGISTFNIISVATTAYVASSIGVGTAAPVAEFQVGTDQSSVIISNGRIGISTASFPREDITVEALGASALFGSIGIGTTSAADRNTGTLAERDSASLYVGKPPPDPVDGSLSNAASLIIDGNTRSTGIITSVGYRGITEAGAAGGYLLLGSGVQINGGNSGILTATTINDSIGNVRDYPQNSQSTSATAYTLQASDVGKHVYITNTTNGIIVPSGVFSVGDFIILVNSTTGTCDVDDAVGATVRLAGSTSTAPHQLPDYGMGFLLCVASNTFILHGVGIV
jgi:hypothetical protein